MDFAPSLTIANTTLVFPLTQTPARRSLSESEPGDLIIDYTRVGCWVDPEQYLGAVDVTSAHEARLTLVTISQDVSASRPSTELAKETCLSVRRPDGTWQPLLQSTNVTITDSSLQLEFAVSITTADAAAIFLPTYTSVSNVTYTIRPL
jgi:hypothetical protein